MGNLLGFQSQVTSEAHATMVRATWPSTLKAIHPGGLDIPLLREWRARRPDGLLVLRHYFPDENLHQSKIDAIIDVAHTISALNPIIECPINEAWQTTAADIRSLSDYAFSFVYACMAHGFKPAVGVFSEGNPSNFEWWREFYPALRAARAANGYLALHEYGVPSLGMDNWHLLRHRRVWTSLPDDCRLPFLITEAGIDGGIEGRREQGWRSYMSAAEYGRWLQTYHSEVSKDEYVHGVTLFLCGGSDQWRTFDIRDEVDIRPALTQSLDMAPRWAPTQEVPVATIKGIDISNNNGAVDFAKVKAAGYVFIGIKASGDEGKNNSYLDEYFVSNWAKAKAFDMPRIAYHYARPSMVTPAQSVTTLQRALIPAGWVQPGDSIALDIEDPLVPDGRSLHVWVAEWLDLAERTFGVRPFKYSADYYTSTHDLEHPDLEKYPTWWASYQDLIPRPQVGWKINIWQNDVTQDNVVPGVNGRCDVNVFEGTVADLRALGRPGVDRTAEITALRALIFKAHDTAYELGRTRFGDDLFDAMRRDKGEIA